MNDTVLAGKLLIISKVIDDRLISTFSNSIDFEQQIKKELAEQIANRIIRDEMCEFSYLDNPNDFSRHYYARVYLLPREQTRIILSLNKK